MTTVFSLKMVLGKKKLPLQYIFSRKTTLTNNYWTYDLTWKVIQFAITFLFLVWANTSFYYLIARPKLDFQAAKVCVWSSKINISFLYKAFRSHRQHIVFQFWMQVLVAFTEFNSLVFKLAQSFLPEFLINVK